MLIVGLLLAGQIATLSGDPAINSAPGSTIVSGNFACSDAATTTALWNSTGALTSDNFMLFPHSGRVVIDNKSLAETIHCSLMDSPIGTLGQVSSNAQSNITDTGGPNGNGIGNTFSIGPMQTYVEIVDYYKNLWGAGARTGLCAASIIGSELNSGQTVAANQIAALDRVRQKDLTVFASCMNGNECSNIAGTASGTACLTTPALISKLLQGAKSVRGQYLKCRCSGATRVYWRIVG